MTVEEDKEDLFVVTKKEQNRKVGLLVVGIVFLLMILATIIGVAVYVLTDRYSADDPPSVDLQCKAKNDACLFTLVESIPENLTYNAGEPSHPSTFSGIQEIISKAENTIEIASFYWTMRPNDLPVTDPSSWQGEQIFKDLVFAGKEKGIKIRIVQSFQKEPVNDTIYLAKEAGAEVRSLNFDRLLHSGILHTKMWLVDRRHFYVGSANLDWRSYTQVKEMGSIIQNCDCLAGDIGKIFDAYWYLATPESSIPSPWPPQYNTMYNISSPMVVNFNGTKYNTFLSSSPPQICPSGRSQDGNTIVQIINNATKYVHIAVMDYFPTTQFSHPRIYWPDIDDAIRSAAFDNHVQVRLLFSYWNNTWPEMFIYLHSLQSLKYYSEFLKVNIEVKLFVVPAFTEAQKNIPYARVNHNKYMVTDKTAYIGTSNWSGDYFRTTGGIGLAIEGSNLGNQSDIRKQLASVFERDWYSQYAFPLDHFNTTLSQSI
ncbi:5'-3' exonuclease PLD3-like [Mercenaria mercenaria]|uniref:5'-3' exonuclease PLD3-like n=1 Tax=Mercenaria mercenaria TaxID=6596 RepID=UPI00234E7132|nr:5'-3' exonuclease PLD3-like [Mercenaria mercenaria]XP_053373166.1 5'-3' exonuclease PLD3-like [Mercenaria mercenaria]